MWRRMPVRAVLRLADIWFSKGVGPDAATGSPGKFPSERFATDEDYRNPHLFDDPPPEHV